MYSEPFADARTARSIAAARSELAQTKAAVDSQNLSSDEVNRMNYDREALARQVEELRAKVAEASQVASEQEMRVTKSMDRFDQHLQDYTSLNHQIGAVSHQPGKSLPGFVEMDYSIDLDLGAEDLHTIRHYGQSKFTTIRPALKSYTDGLREQVAGLQNDVISLEDKHERLGQDVERQQEEVSVRQQQYSIVHEKGEEEKNVSGPCAAQTDSSNCTCTPLPPTRQFQLWRQRLQVNLPSKGRY